MNSILDRALVCLVLAVSAGYAVASLGPRGLRRRALEGASRLLARAPAFLRLQSAAARLAAAARGKGSGACGGCDDCGTDTAPPKEIHVPVGKIGRRPKAPGAKPIRR